MLIPSIVFSATTGLSESKFDIESVPAQVVTEEIWVTNIDTIGQNYEFKTDGPFFKNNVSIIPRKFSLGPQEFQKIVIRFRVPLESQKIYLSLLSLDSNQSNQLQIGNGIKIPVQFNVQKVAGASAVFHGGKDGAINWAHTLVWIFDGALLIGFVYYARARRIRLSHARQGNYKINFV